MPSAHLKKRKDGRYRKVYQGLPFYGYTEKEALENAAAYKRDLDAGLRAEAAGLTVAQYASQWVAIHKAHVGYRQYNDCVNHLYRMAGRIGEKRLRDIVMSDIQEVYNDLSVYKKDHISHAVTTINAMFRSAVVDRLIPFNPCQGARRPKATSGTHRALTAQERELVENMTEHRFYPAVMTMLYAGLRRGEVLALNIDRDIDFTAREIHVREAVRFESNQPIIASPKTEAGERTIPLVDVLANVLRGRHGLVAPSASGGHMSERAFRAAWSSFLTQAEETLNGDTKRWYGHRKGQDDAWRKAHPWQTIDLRTHDFRHSYCTMLYELGIKIRPAMLWMGHADDSMIRQIYTHLSDPELLKSTKQLHDGLNARHKRVKSRVS